MTSITEQHSISETPIHQVEPVWGTTPVENWQLQDRNQPQDVTDILGTAAFEGYHQTQPQDELAMILEEEEEEEEEEEDEEEEEEEEKVEEQPDPADQSTLVFNSKESEEEPFNTAIDTTSDDSAIIMGKPVTTAFISDQV